MSGETFLLIHTGLLATAVGAILIAVVLFVFRCREGEE